MKWRLYRSVEIREQADSYKILKIPINMGAGGQGPWCQSQGRGSLIAIFASSYTPGRLEGACRVNNMEKFFLVYRGIAR